MKLSAVITVENTIAAKIVVAVITNHALVEPAKVATAQAVEKATPHATTATRFVRKQISSFQALGVIFLVRIGTHVPILFQLNKL